MIRHRHASVLTGYSPQVDGFKYRVVDTYRFENYAGSHGRGWVPWQAYGSVTKPDGLRKSPDDQRGHPGFPCAAVRFPCAGCALADLIA